MIRVLLALFVCSLPAFSASAAKVGDGSAVTFNEHVAPIVFNNCTSCHRPGQGAPFALMNYDDVRKRGMLIQAVTEAKFMPPWQAAKDYGHFKDERRLTDEQIGLIGKWVSSGMAEGDIAALPKLPDFPEGWQLGEPDLVVKMETPYSVPADGADIYRNFVAAIGTTEEKWVRAVEFRPGSRTVMHHSLFAADPSGQARALDAKDEEVGYGGMGSGVRGTTSLGGWAVGAGPKIFPQEAPIKMPPNADFIFRSHFHPVGKVESEVSSIAIYYADKPATRKRVNIQLPPLFGRGAGVDIPAGESAFTIREQYTLPAAVDIYSAGPHAHYVGKEFKGWAVLPNGEEVPLIHIPDWDFNWQGSYTYAEPVRLPKGATMHVEITYDNSAENPRNPQNPPKRVTWGLASYDEMGSIGFAALPVNNEDAKLIRADYQKLQAKHAMQAREQMKGRQSTIRRTTGADD